MLANLGFSEDPMFTFLVFNGFMNWLLEIPNPSTAQVPSDYVVFVSCGSSSSGPPVTLQHSIQCWTIVLLQLKFDIDIGIYSNIFILITCNATSIEGWSLKNSNVRVNLEAGSSHSIVPHCNSIDVYHFLGIISNICTKWWTHSYRRHTSHIAR